MYAQKHFMPFCKHGLVALVIISVVSNSPIAAQTTSKSEAARTGKSGRTSTVDPQLLGVWGVDARGGYDFRADGTFIMEGAVTYRFDAANGVWHHWQPSMPSMKVAAEYKASADGKSLGINLKKGQPLTNLKKIK